MVTFERYNTIIIRTYHLFVENSDTWFCKTDIMRICNLGTRAVINTLILFLKLGMIEKRRFEGGVDRYRLVVSVNDAVTDFNIFIKTLKKENSVSGLSNEDRQEIIRIADKYNIKPVSRKINHYNHILYIHKQIFGDLEK